MTREEAQAIIKALITDNGATKESTKEAILLCAISE